MSADCPICCAPFNKSTRSLIKCKFGDCGYEACKTCVRTYLMNTTSDPNCMNCKKVWDLQFIIEKLNRSFYEKEYKQHRKNLLVEREISKLPETMNAAENHKLIDSEQEKMKSLKLQKDAIKQEYNKLKYEFYQCGRRIHEIKSGTVKSEKRKFIMSCPNNNCRGYLSTQYKCQLCEQFTCPHCMNLLAIIKMSNILATQKAYLVLN